MPPRNENELSEPLRSHWRKALAAIELRNSGYAISLLREILKEEPEFLQGRQLLRRTAIARQKAGKKSFFNTTLLSVMKARRELRKDPKRAIEMIEDLLENEPYHRQANLVLKEAAVAAGWLELGVFALQTLLEEEPRDTKLLHELGRLYHELGESDTEAEIYNRITEIDPTDGEAARLGRDAAAQGSMKTGGWSSKATSRSSQGREV
jgi:tetratricopeptide (TPR) repeat protein